MGRGLRGMTTALEAHLVARKDPAAHVSARVSTPTLHRPLAVDLHPARQAGCLGLHASTLSSNRGMHGHWGAGRPGCGGYGLWLRPYLGSSSGSHSFTAREGGRFICPALSTREHPDHPENTSPHMHRHMSMHTQAHAHRCAHTCTHPCTCSHIHVCTCPGTCTFICTCMHTQKHARSHMHISMHIQTHIHMGTHTHVHVHTYSYAHTFTQTWAYLYTHSHIYTYTHTHTCASPCMHIHICVHMHKHKKCAHTYLCVFHIYTW